MTELKTSNWCSLEAVLCYSIFFSTVLFLAVYVVAKSDQVESTAPVWTKTDGTSKVNGFEEMIVPLDAAVDYPEVKTNKKLS